MNTNEACQIMEVSLSISREELKSKYKKLVIKYHPDRNQGESKKFMEIQKAYELLLPLVGIVELKPTQIIRIDFGTGDTYTTSSWRFNFG